MIGQNNLQSRIGQLIEDGTFPRFSIFVGPRGSGKKTFANWIIDCIKQKQLAISYVCKDVKIDTIRDIITGAYKTAVTNIYIIPDADLMSNAAKNALLKVTEEPPNNAYFIMTLEDVNNTLETIRSRATVFYMDRYTPDEICRYARCKVAETGNKEDDEQGWMIIKDLCETPGDVDKIVECGVLPFYDYVQLVVDNIAEVSIANAFKISEKIALKDEDNKYDLKLFWKAFQKVCLATADNYTEPEILSRYGECVLITSRYVQKLKVKGINKQMLFDNWILEIRELWM